MSTGSHKVVAETTADLNRKRALQALALKCKRLADFVISKGRRPGRSLKPSRLPGRLRRRTLGSMNSNRLAKRLGLHAYDTDTLAAAAEAKIASLEKMLAKREQRYPQEVYDHGWNDACDAAAIMAETRGAALVGGRIRNLKR